METSILIKISDKYQKNEKLLEILMNDINDFLYLNYQEDYGNISMFKMKIE